MQFPSAGTSTGAKPNDNKFAVMSSLASFLLGAVSQFSVNSIILAVFANFSRVLLIKCQQSFGGLWSCENCHVVLLPPPAFALMLRTKSRTADGSLSSSANLGGNK